MPNYIIRMVLITDIRPKNEFNNVPQRVLAHESQEIFICQDIFPRVKGEGWGVGGGGGAVDERYVTLGGGCTIQRYEALQGGVKFSGKKRYVTLEWPLSRLLIRVVIRLHSPVN